MPKRESFVLAGWSKYKPPLVVHALVMLAAGILGTIVVRVVAGPPGWQWFAIGYFVAYAACMALLYALDRRGDGEGGHFRLKNRGRKGVKKVKISAKCAETGQTRDIAAREFEPPAYPSGHLPPGDEAPLASNTEDCHPTEVTIDLWFEDGTHMAATSETLQAPPELPPECEIIVYDEGPDTYAHFICPGLVPPEFTMQLKPA